MSGGGSGGGGGSSGTVDYPGYMKSHHNWVLNTTHELVITAQTGNPYLSIEPYSPEYMTRRMHAGLACFDKAIRSFDPLDVWQNLVKEMPDSLKNYVAPEMIDKFLDSPDMKGMFEVEEIDRINPVDWPTKLPNSDMLIFDPSLLNTYLQTIPMDYFSDVTELNKYIDGQKKRLCDSTKHEVLPKFRRGMQDIGAVVTSSFKIGEALIWVKTIEAMEDLEAKEKMKNVEMDKDYRGKLSLTHYDYMGKLAITEYENRAKVVLNRHDYIGKHEILKSEEKSKVALAGDEAEAKMALTVQEIKGKAALIAYEYMFKTTGDILQLIIQKINYFKDVLHYFLEIERMSYTAWKEYTDTKNVYIIEGMKWRLEMMKYMMDALGSIASSAGTSYTAGSSQTNKIASGIGGALTGASTGMMLGAATGAAGGGPIGAAIGGAAGLIGGLL